MAKLANHREIAFMLASMPYPYELKDAQNFIASVLDPEFKGTCLAICEKGCPHHLIGTIGFGPPLGKNKNADETDFGYWLGPDYWGKGYATEAGNAMLQHAFENSKICQLDTDYLVENEASGRVLQKLGFIDMGLRSCHSCASNTMAASRHMRLTGEHWRTISHVVSGTVL